MNNVLGHSYINYAFNFTVIRAKNYNYKCENKTYKYHNTVGKLNSNYFSCMSLTVSLCLLQSFPSIPTASLDIVSEEDLDLAAAQECRCSSNCR